MKDVEKLTLKLLLIGLTEKYFEINNYGKVDMY